MGAVVSLEMRRRVVASFEISNPGSSILVYVLLGVAPGPMSGVLWPPGEDETG